MACYDVSNDDSDDDDGDSASGVIKEERHGGSHALVVQGQGQGCQTPHCHVPFDVRLSRSADVWLHNLAAVGVVRFQHDDREMFLFCCIR